MKREFFDGTGIERLEQRRMMAGDVSASLSGADLVVNGDNNGNEVVIRATAQSGQFVVEGLNGTTINGQQSATISGVTDDLRINLRNGENVLMLTAEGPDGEQAVLNVVDDLQIRTGSGNDIVVLDNVRVGDRVNLRTGDGDDVIVTYETEIRGDFRADTGGGSDTAGFDTTQFHGRMRANLGNGNDHFVLFDSSVSSRMDVNMGSGDDFFGAHDTSFEDDVRLDGSNGNDVVIDSSSDFAADIRVRSIETAVDGDATDISAELDDTRVADAVNLIFAEGTGF